MAAKPKPNDIIKLTFLAAVRDFPERLKLKEHSLEFTDAPAGKIVSAVYGAHSKQMASVVAAKWNREHRGRGAGPNHILQVDASYRADELIDHSEQMVAGVSGWLHLDRMKAELRKELEEMWVAWINADHGPKKAAAASELKLGELALEYPKYVAKLMAMRAPRLNAVVHPVRPSLDPATVLWVASVRFESDRFESVAVRFLPDLKVEL